jgi:hypothetical protein
VRTTLVAQGKPTDAVLVRVHAEQTGSDRELAGYSAKPPSNEVERKLSDALRATRGQLTKQALAPEVAALDQNDFMSFRTTAAGALHVFQGSVAVGRFGRTTVI